MMLVATQGESIKDWKNVKVTMDGSADKDVDSVFQYGISVKSKGKEWTTFHRYNDFVALKTTLGAEADVIASAPFPGKYFWIWPSAAMKEDRRTGLENWLQQVVARASKVIESWKEPLNEFLKKDSEVGVYGKDKLMQFADSVHGSAQASWATTQDQWMQLVNSVNETAQSSWATTATKLQEWYDNGVAACEGNENCKGLSEQLANMKSGVAEMVKNIGTKTEEMNEKIVEAKALNEEVEKAEADLEKVKDSAGSNAEEVKAAEEKLIKAEEDASKKMQEVADLKEEVQELEQSCKATMENPFETAMSSVEL
jgi:hypothetical protein